MVKEGIEEIVRHEIKQVAKKSRISLWIDTYDDFFSDFDPRTYDRRALSDDFLSAARKMVRETKSGDVEIEFLVPKDLRNRKIESVIRERMKEYFSKKHKEMEDEYHKLIRMSISVIILGFIFMIISSLIIYEDPERFIFWAILVVIEPAGWFMVWYGLDKVFWESKNMKKNLKLFKPLSKSAILFNSY